MIADRLYLQVFCGGNPSDEPVGFVEIRRSRFRKEIIDFRVLENVFLRGVIGILALQQCPLRS